MTEQELLEAVKRQEERIYRVIVKNYLNEYYIPMEEMTYERAVGIVKVMGWEDRIQKELDKLDGRTDEVLDKLKKEKEEKQDEKSL